jgi:hypothetical protein
MQNRITGEGDAACCTAAPAWRWVRVAAVDLVAAVMTISGAVADGAAITILERRR